MNPTKLVTLLAFLSTVPACAVSAGAPPSGDPASGAEPQAAGDWSCLPAPPPGTGSRPSTLPAGNSFRVHLRAAYTLEDVSGVQITACDAADMACASPRAQAQVDEMGSATMTMAGGMAAVGYLKVSGPTTVDNYVLLAGRAPAYGEDGLDLTVYTQASLDITTHAMGGMALDPQRGIVRVETQDCAGAPAMGVALTLGGGSPRPTTEYFAGDGAALSRDATATDASGVALAFGVTPGPVSVAGALDGQATGLVRGFAYAGAVTSVVVRP